MFESENEYKLWLVTLLIFAIILCILGGVREFNAYRIGFCEGLVTGMDADDYHRVKSKCYITVDDGESWTIVDVYEED